MAVNLSPVGGAAAQFFDNSGNVLTGGKLYTYSAGTTTPAVTYTSNSGITAHTNPIVLNAAGRVPDSGEIWLTDSVLYKFVLKDSNDVQIATWDNIDGINSNFVAYATQSETATATQGQTVFTLTSIQYTPATDNLAVFVNGSKQILTLNYIETSSTAVTFIDGLNVGDVVQFTTAAPVSTNVVDASNVSYNEGGAGAVDRNVQQKLQENISVKDFGAVGDGVTDDTVAIQDALDYVGGNGGGTVYIPRSTGKYRITSGLRIPSYTCLEGDAPSNFPYNGATDSAQIVADFTDVNQWVIDTATTVSGSPVAYNAFTSGLPDGATFNCTVKNLQISAVNTVPYGAVRMQGCPGATVENVSAGGTGTGLLVNGCWTGSFRFHARTLYYGTIVYGNSSSNSFNITSEQEDVGGVLAKTVPSGYLMPFMNALNGSMIPVLKLSTEAHYNRVWGLITAGDNTSLPNNNNFNIDIERFSGGWFSYYGYSSVFNTFYFEGAANQMDFAVVSAQSNWTANSCHAYLSGTGTLVDLGTFNNISWTPIGLKSYANWGTGPFLDFNSLVSITGVSPSSFGPATPQWNLIYTSAATAWVAPTFVNSWVNVGVTNLNAGYRLNSRTGNVELRGLITGGSAGTTAFTLPAGFRPLGTAGFAVDGGTILIAAGGVVTIATGTTLRLDGIFFEALL